MNISNPNYIQEVKENGYIKLDDIFTNEEIVDLEINCMKALDEASKEHIHANTDFAKVVTVSEKTLNDDNNFNFLVTNRSNIKIWQPNNSIIAVTIC